VTESRLVRKMIEAGRREYSKRIQLIKIVGRGGAQIRGISDIIGCLDGFHFAFEVKLPGRETSYSHS
jgi:hypothetical protein